MTNRKYLGLTVCGVLALGAACGSSSDDSVDEQAQVDSVATAALESPIVACQTQAATCVQSATDVASATACQTTLQGCLVQAATTSQGIGAGVVQCQDARLQCLTAGGAQGPGACFTTYQSCVQALVPAGTTPSLPTGGGPNLPTFDGGLPTLPTFDGGLPNLGGGLPSFDAGLPNLGGNLPSFDGGLPNLGGNFPTPGGNLPAPGGNFPAPGGNLPALPGAACLTTLQTCATTPGSLPTTCADDARKCLAQSVGFP